MAICSQAGTSRMDGVNSDRNMLDPFYAKPIEDQPHPPL